jgi:hypothetical protein
LSGENIRGGIHRNQSFGWISACEAMDLHIIFVELIEERSSVDLTILILFLNISHLVFLFQNFRILVFFLTFFLLFSYFFLFLDAKRSEIYHLIVL